MKKKQPTRGVVTKRFTGVFLIILLSLSLVLLPTPVQAYDTWAYPGWQYRRPITITEQSGTDLTYFQVKISATLDLSKVRSDAGDIRFATAGGQAIPYWIESWDNSTGSITVWVKVPSIPANGQVTIYMYYGNPNAISESNGNEVFLFFDDFEGTSLDTNKWQVVSGSSYYVVQNELHVTNRDTHIASVQAFSVPAVFETKMRTISVNKQLGFELGDNQNHDRIRMYFLVTGGEDVYIDANGDGKYEVVENLFDDSAGDTYDIVSVAVTGTQIVLDFVRNMLRTTKTYNYGWTADTYIGLGGFRAGELSAPRNEIAVDWVRVRKYADIGPTYSIGKEQTSTMGKVIFDFKDVNGNPINQVSVVDASNLTLIGMFDDGDTFLIEQDSYTWTFQKEGYHSVNQTVTVTAQTSTVVSVTLVPTLYAQLILHITDDLTGEPLTGVELYINGTYSQTVDDGDIIYLKAGNYILTFKKDGYQDSSVNVEITGTSNPIHIHVYMQPTSSGSSSTTGGTTTWDIISLNTTWDIISLNTSSYNTTLGTVNISNIYSLFSQWAGGGMIEGLLELNLSKFFEDVFSFNVEVGGKNFSWVGALITSIIWFGGVLVAWFYFKNPLPVIALGRVLYEGLATAKVPSLGYLQYPIAGFMLYMGYLTIKMIFEKWSGEI